MCTVGICNFLTELILKHFLYIIITVKDLLDAPGCRRRRGFQQVSPDDYVPPPQRRQRASSDTSAASVLHSVPRDPPSRRRRRALNALPTGSDPEFPEVFSHPSRRQRHATNDLLPVSVSAVPLNANGMYFSILIYV